MALATALAITLTPYLQQTLGETETLPENNVYKGCLIKVTE